ncbi:hypothetical protein ACFVJ5_31895 [Nocardia sp. NPDC127606]|uniref:hypothetical protein n=1 Tax=Nocardia sp. NPDC127606 TaxID=3345406 RepID=UPI00362FAAD2
MYVREDALFECLERFFNEKVFGPDRTTLLRHQLRGQASGKGNEIAQRITAIEKTVAEITRRRPPRRHQRVVAARCNPARHGQPPQLPMFYAPPAGIEPAT